jgi:hypothetical protein
MRKIPLIILTVALATSLPSQETREARKARRGQAAGYATRDATVMSMMGWGLGLAVGIAALCALVDNDTGSTSH